MVPRREDIVTQLRAHAPELRARFGVTAVSIFGSVGRDEAGADSDVDLLVELDDRPLGLFGWVDLRQYLEGLLNRHVDLGTADAIKQPLRDRILREAIRAV